jgi:hypothetical protein
MAHDEALSRTFPQDGPRYWECVTVLANLSHLEHAVRVLLRFLAQVARTATGTKPRRLEERCRAESLLMSYVSEVEKHLAALSDKVPLSGRNIGLVLAMARRTASALPMPGMLETVAPLIDECHDVLLTGVTRDISEVTDRLPYELDETAEGRLVLRERERHPAGDPNCRVTLRQMSAIVQCGKRTLERLRDTGRLPDPARKGPNGTAHEWLWSEVRPILEAEYNRKLPEVFPAERFLRRRPT